MPDPILSGENQSCLRLLPPIHALLETEAARVLLTHYPRLGRAGSRAAEPR